MPCLKKHSKNTTVKTETSTSFMFSTHSREASENSKQIITLYFSQGPIAPQLLGKFVCGYAMHTHTWTCEGEALPFGFEPS